LIAAAKQDFQTKISVLISSGGGDELERVKKIQEEIIALTEQRQQTANELNEERLRLSLVGERLRLLADQKQQITGELADIRTKLDKAQVKFEAGELEEEKSGVNRKIQALDQEIAKLLAADRSSALQEKRQTIINQLQEIRLKVSSLNERSRLLSGKEEQLTKEIADIKSKIAKSQNKIDRTTFDREKDLINSRLAVLNEEIKKLEATLEKFNQAQEKEKSQMFDCQKNIQAIQQEFNDLLGELNQLKVEATRQETKLEDLENNIRGDELEISAIKDHQITESPVDLDRWHKRLSGHKLQLEQIGGIDPETEKEYQETKERYDFLSQQTDDLDQAIKSLEEVIYELDSNIKDRFDSEFKVISEKFNEYFKILFNGGTAKISKLMIEDLEKEETKDHPIAATGGEPEISGLTREEAALKNAMDDKLKRIKFLKKHNAVGLAGIDIQATPPGKKIQQVAMLSGGERALTAIALICAIISANPSPFVVLDEVDAALDESNSERLAQILDDLSNKTQFIVITHNRASMRKASILYGVTMESDGVSRLLSIKLEDLKK
jgi:chromosome segregation protein